MLGGVAEPAETRVWPSPAGLLGVEARAGRGCRDKAGADLSPPSLASPPAPGSPNSRCALFLRQLLSEPCARCCSVPCPSVPLRLRLAMTTQQIVLQGPGPWGFRLVGGKDFEQPLAISRVRVSWDARGNGTLPWGGGAQCSEGSLGGWSPKCKAVGRIQVRCALSALCHSPPPRRRRALWQAEFSACRAKANDNFLPGPRKRGAARRGKQTCFVPGRGDLWLRTPCSSLWISWGKADWKQHKGLGGEWERRGVPQKASGSPLAETTILHSSDLTHSWLSAA